MHTLLFLNVASRKPKVHNEEVATSPVSDMHYPDKEL